MRRSIHVLLLVMLSLLLCSGAHAATATFSYDYLMSDEFVYEWGPGDDVCKIDQTDSVQFLIGSTSPHVLNPGTGIGDDYDYPVVGSGLSELSGGALLGGSYSDFSGYDNLAVKFTNNRTDSIWITLFMNVNWGTYVESGWIEFAGGEEKVIDWDISGLSGRNHLGNIGFQVADFSATPDDCANITVSAVPVPGALWLLGSGLIGVIGFRRKMTNS